MFENSTELLVLSSSVLRMPSGAKITVLNLTQSFMTVPTAKAYLEEIQKRAIVQWGEKKWKAELAQKFVLLARENGDEKATYENRRRTVYRAFEEKSCHSDTLFLLAAAVGCRFQMACTSVEVIDL